MFNINRLPIVGKTVEEALSEFDDIRCVIIEDESATHIFEEDDVEFIGEELLSKQITEFGAKVTKGAIDIAIKI